jgi:hypothetical protein
MPRWRATFGLAARQIPKKENLMSKRSNQKSVVWTVKAEIHSLGEVLRPYGMYKGVARLAFGQTGLIIYDHRPAVIALMRELEQAWEALDDAQYQYDYETFDDSIDSIQYFPIRRSSPRASQSTINALDSAQRSANEVLKKLQDLYDKSHTTIVSLRRANDHHYLVIGLDNHNIILSTDETEELTIFANNRAVRDRHLLRLHRRGIELINIFRTVNIDETLTVQVGSRHSIRF